MNDDKKEGPRGSTLMTLTGNVTDVRVTGGTFIGFESLLVAKEVDGVGPSDIAFDDIQAYRHHPEEFAAPVMPDKKPWYKDVLYQVLSGVVVLAVGIALTYFGLKGA